MRTILLAVLLAVNLHAQNSYSRLLGLADAPVTPVDSPGGGTYASTQSVTLTDTTSQFILYTLTGTAPACPATGTLYSGAFNISVTTTLKAIGCNGVTGGGVLTSVYTITGGGTPTLVQQTGTNSVTNSIAFGSNVASGDVMIAVSFCASGATCAHAFTWSGGETASIVHASSNAFTVALATDGDTVAISCATASASHAETVTVTGDASGANIFGVFISEWSNASCTLDTTTSPSGGFVTSDNTTSGTISAGPITTTTNNDLIIVAAGASSASGSAFSWSAGSGYSNLQCQLNVSGALSCTGTGAGVNPPFGSESKVLTTLGTTSGTITTGNTNSVEYGVALAAFKP